MASQQFDDWQVFVIAYVTTTYRLHIKLTKLASQQRWNAIEENNCTVRFIRA